jgi:hypothetical protein
MNIDLRFLKKLDGTKVLQFRSRSTMYVWTDIPMVEEIQVKDEVLVTKPYQPAVAG